MFGRGQRYISAVDVGSHKTRAVIAQLREFEDEQDLLGSDKGSLAIKVVGFGEERTQGMERGELVDIAKVADSIRAAADDASVMASVEVKDVVVSLSGRNTRAIDGVGTITLTGSSASKETCAMREIVESDLQHSLEDAKSVTMRSDEKMLHTILQDFSVDDQLYIKNPRGKTGERLTANMKVVLASQKAVNDLERALREAHLTPKFVVLQALASARACLEPDELENGVLLIDLGMGTSDAIIYFRGAPRYMSCLAMGGEFITKDISECMGCDPRSAEQYKAMAGCTIKRAQPTEGCVDSLCAQNDDRLDPNVVKAISSRYAEIFLILRNDIKRLDAEKFIKGGVVLTGGASASEGLCELATRVFGVPARRGNCSDADCFDGALRDPSFASVMGLVLYGSEQVAGGGSFSDGNRSILKRAWEALTNKNLVLT
ncbi:MAG: cell division protein FtsA [Candidatus Coatesbacteria bacterium]|nr:cell division protein FtsA [Candidatus Coatesbacteria bacterium]